MSLGKTASQRLETQRVTPFHVCRRIERRSVEALARLANALSVFVLVGLSGDRDEIASHPSGTEAFASLRHNAEAKASERAETVASAMKKLLAYDRCNLRANLARDDSAISLGVREGMDIENLIFGRTIQLFLVDGTPNGLMIATLHGWTGALVVSRQSTFDKLLKRAELDRTGIYVLYGPDPDNPLKMRAYVGEADSVKDRIATSAGNHAFWETAVAITTSDDALTKGHVRYLEARLWEIANEAGRVTLANTQQPGAEKRRLPEADKANMEAFLANLKTVLPVVGLDLLKPQPAAVGRAAPDHAIVAGVESAKGDLTEFEIRHKSGVAAYAVEENGEFVVLAGSETRKDTGLLLGNYSELSADLIKAGVLKPNTSGDRYVFGKSWPFKSPPAAATIVLQRSANGRKEWKVKGQTLLTYHDWQSKETQPQ